MNSSDSKARQALIARCERDAYNLTYPFMAPTIKEQHEAAQTLRDCAAALQWAASQQAAEVMTTCLCEFGKFVPQPNGIYRPVHMPGCTSCEKLAAEQIEAYGARSPTYDELPSPPSTQGGADA